MDKRYLAQHLVNEGILSQEDLVELLRQKSFDAVETVSGSRPVVDEHPVITAVRKASGRELQMEMETYGEYMELFMRSLMEFLEGPAVIETKAVQPGEMGDVFYAVSQRMDGDVSIVSGILAEGARNVSKDYHFTLVAGGWDGSYYKKSYTGKTFYRGVSEGRALKLPVIGDWDPVTDYIPLDLGIDVRGKRVYWAQKNLGAASEKEAGDYYTWGDIEPYYTGDPQAETPAWKTGKESGYSWASYTRYTDDNGSTFKKYLGYIDSYTDAITLELMDDAANVLLGGDWRIPNMYEAMEGLKSQGNWGLEGENNVDLGHRISSRHAGYAASIFLPWQGYRTGTTLNYPFVHQGGSFWCSTRSNQVFMAHSFSFSLGGVDWSSNSYRNTGLPIRPVTD